MSWSLFVQSETAGTETPFQQEIGVSLVFLAIMVMKLRAGHVMFQILQGKSTKVSLDAGRCGEHAWVGRTSWRQKNRPSRTAAEQDDHEEGMGIASQTSSMRHIFRACKS